MGENRKKAINERGNSYKISRRLNYVGKKGGKNK